jgi:hypothetical protein
MAAKAARRWITFLPMSTVVGFAVYMLFLFLVSH